MPLVVKNEGPLKELNVDPNPSNGVLFTFSANITDRKGCLEKKCLTK